MTEAKNKGYTVSFGIFNGDVIQTPVTTPVSVFNLIVNLYSASTIGSSYTLAIF